MAEIEVKVRQVNMKIAVDRWIDDLRAKHLIQVR